MMRRAESDLEKGIPSLTSPTALGQQEKQGRLITKVAIIAPREERAKSPPAAIPQTLAVRRSHCGSHPIITRSDDGHDQPQDEIQRIGDSGDAIGDRSRHLGSSGRVVGDCLRHLGGSRVRMDYDS